MGGGTGTGGCPVPDSRPSMYFLIVYLYGYVYQAMHGRTGEYIPKTWYTSMPVDDVRW